MIRRYRHIPKAQIVFVVGLGIASGIYIWKPIFENRQTSEIKVPQSATGVTSLAETPNSK